MKSCYQLLALAAVALCASAAQADTEKLVNGGFADSTGWSTAAVEGAPTVEFNYTTATPTGGTGGALHVSVPAATAGHVLVYQAVSLTAGLTYTFSGLAKDTGSGAASVWLEMYLSQTVPAPATDYTTGKLVTFNTWDCAGFDSSFATNCGGIAQTTAYIPPATGTYYVVIKTGTCCGGAVDVVLDNLSLMEGAAFPTGTDELIANGGFGSSADWTEVDLETATANPILNYNETATLPTGGSGGGLSFNSNVPTNYAVYQPILVNEGTLYTLSGLANVQSLGADGGASGHWVEVMLTPTMPVAGTDVTSLKLVGYNSWAPLCGFGPHDSSFSAACDASTVTYVIPDPGNDGGSAQYYLVLKAGCLGAATQNVTFDNISFVGQAGVVAAAEDWISYN